jgi:hypothetical protein
MDDHHFSYFTKLKKKKEKRPLFRVIMKKPFFIS